MNKKTIIAIVIVIIAIAAAAILLGKKPTNKEAGTETGNMKATEQTNTPRSIKALLTDYKNQSCTFQDNQDKQSTEGTMYIGSGKSRGDFNITSTGQKSTYHMIASDANIYFWNDESSTGYKMAAAASDSKSDQAQGIDTNKNFNFSCKDWSPDTTKFDLPKNITFQDMSKFTNPTQTPPSGGRYMDQQSMEAACAQLPEPQKSECTKSLETR